MNKQQMVLPLTGSRSVPDELRCCCVRPAGSPWRTTGLGPTSSRRQQERSPDGRSPPPSTSPETGVGGLLLQKQNLMEPEGWETPEPSDFTLRLLQVWF